MLGLPDQGFSEPDMAQARVTGIEGLGGEWRRKQGLEA